MTAAEDARRTATLAAIRQSLRRARLSAQARGELDARIAAHDANLIPARAQGEGAELVERFADMVEAAACTLARVADANDVPAAVTAYLREHNLPTEAALAPDDWLAGLDWASQPMLELRRGTPKPEDLVSVTPAFAAVAETGTLFLTSGPGHPSTLNFLPDHHLVVLKASQIEGSYEAAFQRLREDREGDGGAMPRTLNMITGPSRTGDIELTIHLGAHGPRSLHIVLIDDQEAAQS